MEIELECLNLHRIGLIGRLSVGIFAGASLVTNILGCDGILPNFNHDKWCNNFFLFFIIECFSRRLVQPFAS